MFNYPPNLPDAVCETYKSADGIKLNIWRFESEEPQSGLRPAILFFFGGGFQTGSPDQFASQAQYLARRGMIAMVADYRVGSRHGVKATCCIEDAKSALMWVQSNAKRLGIDPQHIALGGGSAGGYLAAAAAMVPGFADDTVNAKLQPPTALILFNPAVVMAPVPGMEFDAGRTARLPNGWVPIQRQYRPIIMRPVVCHRPSSSTARPTRRFLIERSSFLPTRCTSWTTVAN